MITGYLATLLFIISLVAGMYLFGYAVRKTSALYVTLLEIVAGIIILFPLIYFENKGSVTGLFTAPVKENWLWLGAAALFGFAGGNYFTLVNLKTAGERWNSLLSPAITVVIITGGIFFFKEKINFQSGTGILITLLAVIFFLLFRAGKEKEVNNPLIAVTSSMASILCISLSVLFSIKGVQTGNITFLHAIWLRLIIALPFAAILYFLFLPSKQVRNSKGIILYTVIALGVICQTILANYLWFYATFKIGITSFQLIIATFPLWVYAADVYLFKKTTSSTIFIVTSLIAAVGIFLAVAG